MKALFLATCVAAAPAMAIAASSQCSVSEFPEAKSVSSDASNADALLPIAIPVVSASRDPSPSAPAIPLALQHVVNAGATISPLGGYHSMTRFVARTGDQLMVLSVTPDEQAIVAGLMSDFSTADLARLAGPNLTEMGSFHGLRGMVVRSGAQFQVFYGTPDGERVIPGVMWDAAGKNLTREQVAPIAGSVPTVVIGDAPSAPTADAVDASAVRQTSADLAAVQTTIFGLAGDQTAARLWMFIDPLCSFSVRAMQQLQPFIASGKLQLAVIPLAVIDHETNGQSTVKALAMLSQPSAKMIPAWTTNSLNAPAVPNATRMLGTNMAVAQGIRLRGTPTLIWRNKDGSEGRSDGLPANLDAVIASLAK